MILVDRGRLRPCPGWGAGGRAARLTGHGRVGFKADDVLRLLRHAQEARLAHLPVRGSQVGQEHDLAGTGAASGNVLRRADERDAASALVGSDRGALFGIVDREPQVTVAAAACGLRDVGAYHVRQAVIPHIGGMG